MSNMLTVIGKRIGTDTNWKQNSTEFIADDIDTIEINGIRITVDRLSELAEAEQEGRVVVLPKKGDKLYYAPYPKGARDCRGDLFFLRNCGDGSGIVKSVSVTVKFDNWSGGVSIKKTWKTLEEAEAERALAAADAGKGE